MEQYKQEFIEFMVESEVLKFGEFTLKSGRKSPFFMNAGAYVTGVLKQELIPSMDLPRATVIGVYSGASPEAVERDVAKPIESAVKGWPSDHFRPSRR